MAVVHVKCSFIGEDGRVVVTPEGFPFPLTTDASNPDPASLRDALALACADAHGLFVPPAPADAGTTSRRASDVKAELARFARARLVALRARLQFQVEVPVDGGGVALRRVDTDDDLLHCLLMGVKSPYLTLVLSMAPGDDPVYAEVVPRSRRGSATSQRSGSDSDVDAVPGVVVGGLYAATPASQAPCAPLATPRAEEDAAAPPPPSFTSPSPLPPSRTPVTSTMSLASPRIPPWPLPTTLKTFTADCEAAAASDPSHTPHTPKATPGSVAPAVRHSPLMTNRRVLAVGGELDKLHSPPETPVVATPLELTGEDVVVPRCTWQHIAVEGAGAAAKLWWTEPHNGTFGWCMAGGGEPQVVAADLHVPTHVKVCGGRVFVVEEGGVWPGDGRVSCYDPASGRLRVIMDALAVPRALDVTAGGDVYCVDGVDAPAEEDMLGADVDRDLWHPKGAADDLRQFGVRVLRVSGPACDAMMGAEEPPTPPAPEVLLHREGHRTGRVTALAVLPDGHLLLFVLTDVGDDSREARIIGVAFLERYWPDSADGAYALANFSIERGLPEVTSIAVDVRMGLVYHAGTSRSADMVTKARCVALGRARLPAHRELGFQAMRLGNCLCVCVDEASTVYFVTQAPEAATGGAASTTVRRVSGAAEHRLPASLSMSGTLSNAPAAMMHSLCRHQSKASLEPSLGTPCPMPSPKLESPASEAAPSAAGDDEDDTAAAFGALRQSFTEGVNVQVALRCRPLLARELAAGAHPVITCRRHEVEVDRYASYVQRKAYLFHRVFGTSTKQEQLYNTSIIPIVKRTLEGYNCTVFAYGQTGTGKTFTLEGDLPKTTGRDGDTVCMSERAGIIPRCIHTIFEELDAIAESYTVHVSHLEIYNEELSDLLEATEAGDDPRLTTTSKSLLAAARKRGIPMVYVPPSSARDGPPSLHRTRSLHSARTRRPSLSAASSPRLPTGRAAASPRDGMSPRVAGGSQHRPLRIVKDAVRGVVVQNLTEVPVKSPTEIFKILSRSIARRVTFETQMNQASSRSHAIFSIQVSLTMRTSSGERVTNTGRLNLVDLSGSENLKRSGSEGARQTEASNINRGLLALGRVIKGIADKRSHVPYRDSKLTRLLEESLGGNSLTLMILTISPCNMDADEAVSTLNYANMAKLILNRPHKNRVSDTGEQLADDKPEGDASVAELVKEAQQVRPWTGAVPMRARMAKYNYLVRARPKLLHATSVDWVAQHAVDASGRLLPKAAATLAPFFKSFAGSLDARMPPPSIRALATAIRRMVFEHAVRTCGKDSKPADAQLRRRSNAVSPIRSRPTSAQTALTIGFGGSTPHLRRLSSASRLSARPISAASSRRLSSRPASASSHGGQQVGTLRPATAPKGRPVHDTAAIAAAAALAATQVKTNEDRAAARSKARAEALLNGPRPGPGGSALVGVAAAKRLSKALASQAGVSTVPTARTSVRLPPTDLILSQFLTKYGVDLDTIVSAAVATDLDAGEAASSKVLHPGMGLTLARFLAYMTHKAKAQPMLVWLLLTTLDKAPEVEQSGRATHGGLSATKRRAEPVEDTARLAAIDVYMEAAASVPVPPSNPDSLWSWLEEPTRKALAVGVGRVRRGKPNRVVAPASPARATASFGFVQSPVRTPPPGAVQGVPAMKELTGAMSPAPVLRLRGAGRAPLAEASLGSERV